MGNLLQGLAQGFESFTTNKPLGGIQDRDESRRLKKSIGQSGDLQGADFQALSALDSASATKLKSLLKTDDQGLDVAFQDAAVFRSQLEADPTGQRGIQFLQNRVQAGESQGRDMFLTKGLLETAMQSPQAAMQEVNSFLAIPSQLKGQSANKPAGIQEFDYFVDKAQNGKTEAIRNSAKIKLGTMARASTSAQERIAQDPALAQLIADVEGLKEGSKLGQQLKIGPQITKAKEAAKQAVTQVFKTSELKRGNDLAYNVYSTGIKSLTDSFAGTDTGPFMGLLPAWTASQQMAEGGLAIMAPVMKQMFRAAGEGTFTKDDQEILMAMLPKRDDHESVVKYKLQAVDATVKAKLGITSQEQPTNNIQDELDEINRQLGLSN